MGDRGIGLGKGLDPLDKPGTRDTKFHGCGFMAIGAGYRVPVSHLMQFCVQILIRPAKGLFKTFHGIALTQCPVEGHDGRVAV